MDEKLRKDIEACVAAIFSEKEEADMRKKTEEALQKAASTIEDLTNALEERNGEMEDLEVKISESDNKITDLTTELEAAREEVKTVEEKLSESENTLEEIKKDRAADVRMSELEEAGVAHSNEEAKANQIAKVREMSDEDYAAYKDELISIRQAVLDELAVAAETESEEKEEAEEETSEEKEEAEEKEETEEKEEAEEETEEKEEAEEKSEEKGEETPPAKIDPDKTALAALNMDVRPSAGMLEKYAEFGQAMAEAMK